MRFGSARFALSHVVETSVFVGDDSVTAFADGTIAEEKSAAISESNVIFLIMILLRLIIGCNESFDAKN
jgi:hypothetical protein